MPGQLGYWSVRGLTQHIRLLLEYTGTEYVEKRYELGPAPDFSRSQFRDVKDGFGFDLPNMPYYIDGKHKITQSNAIMRYIARKHNMSGNTEEEIIAVDMLENQAFDMRMAWSKTCYFPTDFEKEKATYLKETLPDFLKLLEDFIGKKKWFVGDKITYVDFLIYELLDINKALAPKCLDKFKNLKEFVTRFESLDAIKKYLSSSKFIKSPINGPMAAFVG